MKNKEEKIKKKTEKQSVRFPQRFISILADEVAKTIVQRLPGLIPHPRKEKSVKRRKIDNPIFLDTSAIIDGRIFDVISLGVFTGTFVVLDRILLELKHIADSKDLVKRVRGRKGLDFLEKLKKAGRNKVIVLESYDIKDKSSAMQNKEVDEELIQAAKAHKARIITCDYNLEKKASIGGVLTINVNTLANDLKITAVPGESLHIKMLHRGKDITQGVGYLDDGTMLVVENGSQDLGKEVDVIVARVIQTTAGRILFAKKI